MSAGVDSNRTASAWRRFNLFDRLYRWESASRKYVYRRHVLVVALFVLPSFTAIIALSLFAPVLPKWVSMLLEGVMWLSIALLFLYIVYSILRATRVIWRAIRAKPHEAETWREP